MSAKMNSVLASVLALLAGCNQQAGRPVSLVERSAESVSETDWSVFEDGIRSDVFFLASARLEGRGVYTQGIDLAADYVATRFAALGLKTLPGMKDYFQPFEMTVTQSVDKATTLSSGEKKYALERDFTAATFSANKEFEGDVVFAGYGISDKERKYDDYENLDVKGKVVLALRYEPHDEKGKSRFTDGDFSPNASLDNKARIAFERGAKALVIVNPPKWHDTGSDPYFTRSSGSYEQLPLIQVKRAVAEEWLKRGGAPNLAALQDTIDKNAKPVTHALAGVSVSGTVKINRVKRTVKNVMAMIPGSGPKAGEYVVIGAHYDHLGLGGRGSLLNIQQMLQRQPGVTEPGDPHAPVTRPAPTTLPAATHHGADDNASGTSAMLELARIMSKRPAPPRTLVFVAFTAEESGLLGSGHFVRHPPIDLSKTAAMLNLDMVGRIRKNLLYVGGSGTAEPLEAILKRADERSPLEFKNFGKGGLGPSDHMSFALKKVPVIFFFSGTHEDYHRPSDTAEKINYDGIEQVVRAGVPLVDEMAKMPLSKYIDSADKHTMMGTPGGPGGEGVRRASLGVIPEYGAEEDGKGVKIGGASEGSAAAKAGLKSGDVITKLGNHSTGTLVELSAALAAQKPGDKVKVTYVRDGKERTVELVLGERKGG